MAEKLKFAKVIFLRSSRAWYELSVHFMNIILSIYKVKTLQISKTYKFYSYLKLSTIKSGEESEIL